MEGTDLIQASVTYTASSNVENLTLTGSSDINATGNSLDNILTGNDGDNILNGGSGSDTLDGKNGDDALFGGDGDDQFKGGTGKDTAVFSSKSNVINLSTTKKQNTNDGKDILIGIENVNGGGGNDKLYGSKGSNILNGGKGCLLYTSDAADEP